MFCLCPTSKCSFLFHELRWFNDQPGTLYVILLFHIKAEISKRHCQPGYDVWVWIPLCQSLESECTCISVSLNRQMFLQVGTLTQQPPHSAHTLTQGAPRPSLHTNQFENKEISKRENGVWRSLCPSDSAGGLHYACQTLYTRDEPTQIWQNVNNLSWYFSISWGYLEEFSFILWPFYHFHLE